ncbi:MAG: hypothetical protein G01um10148_850 [Parcubacteria group bacterium Gr01-1014_8]|nr:MAG: hypothetical protein G01um10148_850 [Parcubacteria group bacterium Gr01-1014_8]
MLFWALMLSFFGRASKGKPVFVCEVESGSVAAAVVVLHSASAARVLSAERASLPLEQRTREQVLAGLPTLLGEASERVLKKYAEGDTFKAFGIPKTVHAIVGSPWVRSRTAHAEKIFEGVQAINNDVIQGLAKQALEQPSELNVSSLFETNVVRVYLNGYPTAKPLGKKAKSVGVTAFQSDIEPQMKQGIEGALGKHLPGRLIDFRSHMRALQTVLHEHSALRQYFVITVGSESTDCIAIRKDEIAEHASVPEGTSTLTRRVAGEKGLPEESVSLMRMLLSDTCVTAACDELKAGLAKTEPELTKLFGETFSVLATPRRVPNSCILHVAQDFAPWYEHFFSRLDFSPFTMTTQPLKVESITPEHISNSVTWDPGVKGDTGLGIASAFLNLNAQST